MSKKAHFKIRGSDCRDFGQTEHEYSNQALCGFAGVTVTREKGKVTCKMCLLKLRLDGHSPTPSGG